VESVHGIQLGLMKVLDKAGAEVGSTVSAESTFIPKNPLHVF
jgi:hypothetical protein